MTERDKMLDRVSWIAAGISAARPKMSSRNVALQAICTYEFILKEVERKDKVQTKVHPLDTD